MIRMANRLMSFTIIEEPEMKLTAHELAVILDTFNHSLMVSNWNGFYTDKSRESVRNVIADIMNEMSVEIITDTPKYTIDADAGI
jgi:hypothetical protein